MKEEFTEVLYTKEWFEVLSKEDLVHILHHSRFTEYLFDDFVNEARHQMDRGCSECEKIAARLDRKSKVLGYTILQFEDREFDGRWVSNDSMVYLGRSGSLIRATFRKTEIDEE
jgi:hypothetical protein